jgi:hypothetical protein
MEKMMGSLYTVPRKLFWRRWQPKLSKLSQHFFFDLVRELSYHTPHTHLKYWKGKKKEEKKLTGYGGPQDWDVEAPTFSRQSAHRWQCGCQPYTPAALYTPEYSWFSLLLEAESTPGP